MHCFNCLNIYEDSNASICDACGSPLLVQGYRAVKSLNLDTFSTPSVLEVIDGDGVSKVVRLVRGSERIRLMEDIVMGLRLIAQLSIRSFCPNVIDTFFWSFDDSEEAIYCVLLEKIEGPSLKEYVDSHGASDAQVIVWMTQLFEMVDVFHGQSWLFRDIKPENFVVNSDGQLIFVDIDSFLHWPWDEDSPFVHLSSPGYTAPEQNDRRPVSASDVFSIGRTAIFCLTGRSPIALYDDDGFTWRDTLKNSSSLLLDFIDQLVALNPIDRPTVKDSINYLRILPAKIRKNLRWNRYKWPVTIILGLITLGVSIPLERRLSSWSNRIRADQQQLAGNIEQATTLYERSLRTNSRNASAYLGLGMTCVEEGCGIEHLEKALTLEPDNDLIAYNLAVLYETLDVQRSLELYDSISLDASRYALAQNNIARLEILRDNTEQAIIILDHIQDEEVAGRIGDDVLAKAYKNKGLAYVQVGDYQRAQESLKQSLVLDPLLGDSYCLLAFIDPQHSDLVSCFSLASNSPESREIKAQLLSKYFQNDDNP